MSKFLLKQNLNWLWSSLVVDELLAQGITHFYLSPGMRNAPLIAALYHRQTIEQREGLTPSCFIDVVMDERSAAYRAIGHAKTTGRSAVLICTSGTALANYMPAVVESWKSRLPMIVISSDRPPELNTSDANQTIPQDHFFGKFATSFLNLGTPTESIAPRALRTSVANMVAQSQRSGLGGPAPVHINFPFRDPLDGQEHDAQGAPLISSKYLNKALEKNSSLSTIYSESYPQVPQKALEKVVSWIKKSPRTLLVVGELPPWIDNRPIDELIQTLKTPLFLDVGSSLKYQYPLESGENTPTHPLVMAGPSFDHPEVFEQYKKNPPDLIIHLGGRLVARHYYELLALRPDISLLSINDAAKKEDPSHQTKMRLVARPDIFARDLLKHLNPADVSDPKDSHKSTADFQFQGIDWRNFIRQKGEIIDSSAFSYPCVSKTIIEMIPDGSDIYLGNSTVIRSFDSYASESVSKKLRVITHRGASGIEGFISAACGHCETKYFLGQKSPTTLVLGDVSAIHDLGALTTLAGQKRGLVIIIVNNFGGGIFTLLPLKGEELLLRPMLSPHEISFEGLSQGLHIPYQKVHSKDELSQAYTKALGWADEAKTSIIEAHFNHQANSDVYKKLRTIQL